MARVFVGIGTNEGDRLANISRAVQRLGALEQTRLVQMASIYDTQPVGGPPQGDYLNTVVEIDTALEPERLLVALKAIEREFGRRPDGPRWGPRPIDLDVLLYDGAMVQQPQLTIPHLMLHRRRFVLEPLAQLAPSLIHPVLRRTINELLSELSASGPPA
jgi:2-amino-4-hydroxy-6-hydroxymethyldihydropteridine diphosphokinase